MDNSKEITINKGISIKLNSKEIQQHAFKYKVLRNKQNGKKVIVLESIGAMNKAYDFEELMDFEFKSSIEDSEFMDSLKHEMQNERAKETKAKLPLNQNSLPFQVYSYSLKPGAFMRSYNQKPQNFNFSKEDPTSRLAFPKDPKKISILSRSINYSDPVPSGPYRTYPNLENTELYRLMANGPWKRSYIVFGFDPKASKSALPYQIIDIVIKEKNDIDFFRLYSSNKKNGKSNVYDPTYQRIPDQCREIYQICDIEDEHIKAVLKEAMAKEWIDRVCTDKYGWMTSSEYRQIYKIMKDKLKLI